MTLLKFISQLPFPVLYCVSDVLYFFLWHIIRYRRKVVFHNLQQAFPEKTLPEIKQIAKNFYRHLTDVIVETLKTLTISKEEITRRVQIANQELVDQYYEQGQSIIIATSHQGNWEWLLASCSLQLPFQVDAIYMELANSFFDRLMKKIRSRFGAFMVEKKVSYRKIIRRKHLVRIIAMVADQSAKNTQQLYWTTFLHQETGFYLGPQRIAHKTQMPVIFVSMYRLKRGFYRMQFHQLDTPPFKSEPDFITERYARAVEKAIRKHPAEWLWSHKRWKRKRHTPASPTTAP